MNSLLKIFQIPSAPMRVDSWRQGKFSPVKQVELIDTPAVSKTPYKKLAVVVYQLPQVICGECG